MKWLIIGIMLITCSCQSLPNQLSGFQNQQTTFSPSSREEEDLCSESPKVVLKSENVKSINLSEQPIIESGIAKQDQAIGYTFKAEKGQRFSYQTDDNLCVWIYTPEQQLLNSTTLPKKGIYTVEILTPIGSRTFEIEMSLNTVQANNSNPTINKNNSASFSPSVRQKQQFNPTQASTIQQASLENTIQNYYSAINQSQYQTAWNQLSEELRNNSQLHPKGYNSYIEWWTKVNYVNLNRVNLVSIYPQEAIVNVDLTYRMKTGRQVFQSLQFFLVWNQQNSQWNINKVKSN
ncbi:hypothetical protein [Gloeothece verrucosa]|uniref:ARC6 IMS domain-containing protein n=1 Tax=Gloeothece verrucosa (strain PCC 7822) TaxID=497965 RepID=E0UMI3_GLOV7|nr:hypothetical protein [Gloeothece verrucosa]ADN18163.1 conserved hypothetical protein [Gloeothece verrucosa PCC 7822]